MTKIWEDGPSDAQIALIIDSPSADDLWKGVPLATTSGKELAEQLHHAGLIFADCKRMSAWQNQVSPFGGWDKLWTSVKATAGKHGLTSFHEGFFCTPEILAAREAFRARCAEIPAKILVPMGDFSLWCLTGEVGLGKWRGSILRFGDKIVVPTLSPSYIFRAWDERPFAIRDFQRIKEISLDFSCYANPPEKLYAIRPTLPGVFQTLQYILHLLGRGPVRLACDIETIARHIACIGIAWNSLEALCIPLMVQGGTPYWTYDEELSILLRLREILTHPNARIIGQNFNYDNQHFAKHLGYICNLSFDTMIAQHVMFPGTPKDLGHLSSLYCKHHVYWKDELKEYHKMPEDLERFWRYNADDCCRTFEVADRQEEMLREFHFEEQYAFLHELSLNVLRTMLRGMAQDQAARNKVTSELMDTLCRLDHIMFTVIGRELNTGSPPQMKEFFYEELALPVQVNKKTKKPSCDAVALEKLCAIQPLLRPLVDLILTKRSVGVFLSTFCMMPLDSDRRMRTSFNICGAETFRFSSSENAFGNGGNLQNIPKNQED